MADVEAQVIVVGAGPTGLMAAHLLRRAGVEVRVVEKRTESSAESRAGVVSARSLELFASIGLADAMLARGVVNSNIDFFVSGEPVGGLRYDQADAPDTPYQFLLMIPQAKTERVLIDGLDRIGFAVDRDVEVTGLVQDEEAVHLTATRSGEPITLRADYVLGADGAHSIVRQQLALEFEGAKYAQNFLLGDVEVDWDLDHTSFRIFMHGDRIGLFLPLQGDGVSRVMSTDMAAVETDDPASASPMRLEELQEAFGEAACRPVTLRNPQWLTHFGTHHRCVDRYRVGRVFVAGDAAHIHSPAGGQGMNTGLQDAANIAWKLAAVLNGGAPDALLDSYGAERLPVAREVLRLTDRLFTVAAGQSGWRARLRDALAPVVVPAATGLDFIQNKAFRTFGQLDIVYPAGIAAVGGTSEKPTAPLAGHRAPNAQLSRHRDLFDLIGGYRFTLLALSRRRIAPSEIDALAGRLASLASDRVRTCIVARLTVGRHEAVEPVERAEVFDRYGLAGAEDQALILIRPDGFIAWRSEDLDLDAAQAVMASMGAIVAREAA